MSTVFEYGVFEEGVFEAATGTPMSTTFTALIQSVYTVTWS